MADQKIPFEYQTQFGDAAEEEQIAKMLMAMQQQQRPALAGSMVSNHYVRPSWTQYMADLFASYQGGQARKRADQLRRGATERMAADESTQISRIMGQALGQPEVQGNEMDVGQPGIQPDLGRAASLASASKFPNVQKLGDDLRARWQTQMTTGASKADPASAVTAAQTGRTQDLKPLTYGPVTNVAPPGMRPVLGQTESSGKVRFGPGEPVTVNTGDRADRALVGEHYKMLMDPKMRGAAETASTTLSAATQALNIIAKVPLNMGTGAGAITEIQKLAKFAGKEVDPRAPASEVYQALIIPQVGQIITMFGAGTGLSDADREFAKQAVALLQRDPRAAQALLMETIKRSWKYATNYNQMAGAGEGLASTAGMNPEIFKSIAIPIQFTVAKELNLPDNPWEWPDAYQSIEQQTRPGPAQPQGPVRKRW